MLISHFERLGQNVQTYRLSSECLFVFEEENSFIYSHQAYSRVTLAKQLHLIFTFGFVHLKTVTIANWLYINLARGKMFVRLLYMRICFYLFITLHLVQFSMHTFPLLKLKKKQKNKKKNVSTHKKRIYIKEYKFLLILYTT